MSNIFPDCDYRYINDKNEPYCKNKQGNNTTCDNCKMNIHLNCDNYNPRKDYCLKFFKDHISNLKECQEKTIYNDKELSKKWSN